MSAEATTLRRISSGELDEVISRLAAEEQPRLALLGRGVTLPVSRQDWSHELRSYPIVFQLTEAVDHLSTRLLALSELRSLYLSNHQIGEAGAKHIASLTQLTSLNLGGNQIGDSGAKHIASLTQLASLDLEANNIGDVGARALGKLYRLTSLSLKQNPVSDLTPMKGLTRLASLNISNTKVTDLSPLTELFQSGVPALWEANLHRLASGVGVEGCPLIRPSPEIVKQGHDAVLNYFREAEDQGVDQLFEAKGQGRILACAFHPELTQDPCVHRPLLEER